MGWGGWLLTVFPAYLCYWSPVVNSEVEKGIRREPNVALFFGTWRVPVVFKALL